MENVSLSNKTGSISDFWGLVWHYNHPLSFLFIYFALSVREYMYGYHIDLVKAWGTSLSNSNRLIFVYLFRVVTVSKGDQSPLYV